MWVGRSIGSWSVRDLAPSVNNLKVSFEQPARNMQQKSGNWGLDKIDCHRLHKGQCTLEKDNLKNLFEKKKFWKIFLKKFLDIKQNDISDHCTKSQPSNSKRWQDIPS